MDKQRLSQLRLGLTQLEDEWLAFTEGCALLTESQSRLLSDHPNIAPEVIMGAERRTMELRLQGRQHNQKLCELRQLLQHVTTT
jgi:hypothetical protein